MVTESTSLVGRTMVDNDQVDTKAVALYKLETRFAMAVRQRELLEKYIRERLKPDKHFYTIGDEPGRKPSLTKEGAELICLPHGLKGHYHWLSGPNNPPLDDAPYQITIKCELEDNGKFEGEGIGSASSMITKKTGERVQRQKDPGLRHNATVKMACKSSYIAATLNSTAASEFFTQDLEDDQTGDFRHQDTKEHWCPIHNCAFHEMKKGKSKWWSHAYKDESGNTKWCNEDQAKKEQAESPEREPEGRLLIDMDWLKESLQNLSWKNKEVISYLSNIYHVEAKATVTETLSQLSEEQQSQFHTEVQDRLGMMQS